MSNYDMSNYVKNTNEDNFQDDVLDSKLPVFVDFWAPWCMPCRVLGSVVELLAEKYDGKISFVKVNVDENPNLSKKYQITWIPNVKIIKNNKILQDLVGVKHPDEYENILNEILN